VRETLEEVTRDDDVQPNFGSSLGKGFVATVAAHG
jgi:hypothetical protein